jgi:hypothetical protein
MPAFPLIPTFSREDITTGRNEMKGYWTVLCFSMLAMPALASAADRLGCDSVNFGEDVLAKFPNAKAACIDVREKNGGIYAHYRADVVAVDKDKDKDLN